MATVDSAKEEVGWLKVLFAVLAAVDAPLIAWISQTSNAIGSDLYLLAVAGARKIRELENL
ncbi:MAG TPA: hypothetical protein VE085_05325 [Burkholderiales bacterium]|nr:hypothetical protein [Burkholderiales bacterium]